MLLFKSSALVVEEEVNNNLAEDDVVNWVIFLKYINYRVLLLLLLYVSFECVCVYLIERVCRARAENSEVVRWDRILLPKKGEGKPLLFLPKRKSTGNQGLALGEKREKR